MSRVARGVLVLVVLMAAAEAMVPAQADRTQFRLAVLRRDGILVPFASFDGRRWSSPWPTPAYHLEAPLTLDAVPGEWWGSITRRTMTWTLYPAKGEPRVLFMKAPAVFPAHCLSNVGLTTDYRSPESVPPPTQHHHPKDGLAVMGTQIVAPVEVLQESSPDWTGTLKLITPTVAKAQLGALGNESIWTRVTQSGVCPPLPPTLEVLCRFAATGGRSVYYYETLGRFGRSTAQGLYRCGFATFIQGFAIVEGQRLTYVSAHGTYSNGDMREVDYGVPLGVLMIKDRMFWVMQRSGRGRESYSITEVFPGGVKPVLTVPGGGC